MLLPPPTKLTATASPVTVEDKQQYTNWVYPVGAVYISVTEIDPEAIFGGKWERVGGRFLLGADETYKAGSTGGEATHTLTTSEIPKHSHTRGNMEIYGNMSRIWTLGGTMSGAYNIDLIKNHHIEGFTEGGGNFSETTVSFKASKNWTGSTSEVGSDQPHNNMPPYLTVYMWKRIE